MFYSLESHKYSLEHQRKLKKKLFDFIDKDEIKKNFQKQQETTSQTKFFKRL